MTRRLKVSNDVIWLEHGGERAKTRDAVLFVVGGKEMWFPKTVLVDYDAKVLGVRKWFADKRQLRGRW